MLNHSTLFSIYFKKREEGGGRIRGHHVTLCENAYTFLHNIFANGTNLVDSGI